MWRSHRESTPYGMQQWQDLRLSSPPLARATGTLKTFVPQQVTSIPIPPLYTQPLQPLFTQTVAPAISESTDVTLTVAQCSWTPNFPSASSSSIPSPYILCTSTGNISVCAGCRNRYPKQPHHSMTPVSGIRRGESTCRQPLQFHKVDLGMCTTISTLIVYGFVFGTFFCPCSYPCRVYCTVGTRTQGAFAIIFPDPSGFTY